MTWVRPIDHGFVVRGEVPGPDVDEFAEPDRIVAELRRHHNRTLLAVQHPHRTPAARKADLGLLDALSTAKTSLSVLLVNHYRAVTDVVAPYEVDGPDGTATGLLCMVDPAAVDDNGVNRVRHSEETYPDVVAERAKVLAGLGYATSAAMLVPTGARDTLTDAIRRSVAGVPADVSTVDSSGRRHRLWLLGPGEARAEVLAEASADPLLVADGNHRVAAAVGAGQSGMLALVTAGPRLRIGAFHRVLTGTGLTAAELAEAWRSKGIDVRDSVNPPTWPGTVVVRCPNRTLEVTLPSGHEIDHAVVEELLLRDALGIDPEGPNVRPLPGDRQPPAGADAVLQLAPVPLGDVLAFHASGRPMPRKSTYFTPKPRSGLLLAKLGSGGGGTGG